MKPLSRDAHAPLIRAIQRIVAAENDLDAFLPGEDRQTPISTPWLVIEHVASEPWASATFVGQKHRIAVRLEGDPVMLAAAQARLATLLGDAEIAVPGHIVADIALTGATMVRGAEGRSRCRLRFDALTIED